MENSENLTYFRPEFEMEELIIENAILNDSPGGAGGNEDPNNDDF